MATATLSKPKAIKKIAKRNTVVKSSFKSKPETVSNPYRAPSAC